jgi:hypothetical protein
VLFAGVPIPPGTHEVIFSRRIGRGWWWVSGLAAILCVALSVAPAARRLFRRPLAGARRAESRRRAAGGTAGEAAGVTNLSARR